METTQIILDRADVVVRVDYNYQDFDVEVNDIEIVRGSLLTILDHYNKCQDIITEIEEKIYKLESI
jgi:hypothetical protein